MKKLALINLKDRFTIGSIWESNTFEPDFLDLNDDTFDKLINYQSIMYYSSETDIATVQKIRKKLYFFNIKLIILTDAIDLDMKKQLQNAGADFVWLLPDNLAELINYLNIILYSFKDEYKFNENLLNVFKQAVLSILSTMALLDATYVTAYISSNRFFPESTISVMDLKGEDRGNLLITFSKTLTNKIIHAIMAIPPQDITDEIEKDGVCEIMNMVSGGVKSRLSYTDGVFMTELPKIITPDSPHYFPNSDSPYVVIIFKVEGEYFALQVKLPKFLK